MPQIALYETQVDPSFKEVGRIRMAQRVNGGLFSYAAGCKRAMKSPAYAFTADMAFGSNHKRPAMEASWKKPYRVAMAGPTLAQLFQGMLR